MKLKHEDLKIDQENPFGNCKLNRKQYADVLTNIVNQYADGFVLAINNEWGTGKTTFVKMWKQQLDNEGFKTLYFNAWENDFENGALAAIMAELSSLKVAETEELFKKVLKTGAKLAKGAIPTLIKAAVAKYLDKETLKELFEGVTDSANELLQEQIEDYTTKKKGLKEFKVSLTEFVTKTSAEKPIVFIIDELDRCRPNYAVDVLEKVKHFFDVPRIVFVISVDKLQLANAVRGAYGSEAINAEEYLRRFIDIEYVIPEPDTKAFCKYLFEYFNFNKFFYSETRQQFPGLIKEGETFLDFAIGLFSGAKLTLRQQEKIFVHVRVALNSFKAKENVFPMLLLILLFLRIFHHNVFKSIKTKELTPQELIENFERIIPIVTFNKDACRELAFAEAQLIYFYNNLFDYSFRVKLLTAKEGGGDEITLKSRLNDENENIFTHTFKHYSINSSFYGLSLTMFLDRIELIVPNKQN